MPHRSAASHSTSDAKRRTARSVLRWVSAWADRWVPSVFHHAWFPVFAQSARLSGASKLSPKNKTSCQRRQIERPWTVRMPGSWPTLHVLHLEEGHTIDEKRVAKNVQPLCKKSVAPVRLMSRPRTTARGFEPLRAEPNGFRVHLLSRSDTLSYSNLPYFVNQDNHWKHGARASLRNFGIDGEMWKLGLSECMGNPEVDVDARRQTQPSRGDSREPDSATRSERRGVTRSPLGARAGTRQRKRARVRARQASLSVSFFGGAACLTMFGPFGISVAFPMVHLRPPAARKKTSQDRKKKR